MIPYLEALKYIEEIALTKQKNLKTEKVTLLKSVGRIASKVVLSTEQVPPFDNSAMDGFAFKSAQTTTASDENPLSFDVLGVIAAGDAPKDQTHFANSMNAFEIMTGAAMPESYDSCTKIEDCEVFRDSKGKALRVLIRAPSLTRKNVRDAGHDFQKGAPLLGVGDLIRAEHILALASAGETSLEVYSELRVALIATGKELVHFEKKPETWQIRNSTQPYLSLVLSSWPTKVETFLLSRDDKDEFKNLIKKLSVEHFDLIVSTGAVSMGQFDFIAEALSELKAKTLFHKVAIRPGKPILFAELDSTVIFSLPGNPISSVVGFRFFIESFMRTLFSRPKEKPMRFRLQKAVSKPKGFRCFFKARLNLSTEAPDVEILEGQMSSMVSSLLYANSWVALSEEDAIVKNGQYVDVYALHSTLQGDQK